MESQKKILKIIIFNFSSMIPLVKSAQIPTPLNFNLSLQMGSSIEILKILMFYVLSIILLVKLN